jgi:uncharacterized protein (TIGR03435 family)
MFQPAESRKGGLKTVNQRLILLSSIFSLFSLAQDAQVQVRESAAAFDAASIKPSVGQGHGFIPSPGMVRIRSYSLKALIAVAYRVKDYQVVGGPSWVSEAHFDIIAKSEKRATTLEMLPMLKILLEQRFGLGCHREIRSVQGYGLVVGRGAAKLKVARVDETPAGVNWSLGQIEAHKITMERFAEMLGTYLHAPVVDRTGLDGAFNFQLRWSIEQSAERMSDDCTGDSRFDSPSLFTALHEQLGLKLEARRVATDVIIIDRAAKPTAN